MLLVELGATRERVSWLLAQYERLNDEVAAAVGQAQAHAELASRARSRAVNWRLVDMWRLACTLSRLGQTAAGLLRVNPTPVGGSRRGSAMRQGASPPAPTRTHQANKARPTDTRLPQEHPTRAGQSANEPLTGCTAIH